MVLKILLINFGGVIVGVLIWLYTAFKSGWMKNSKEEYNKVTIVITIIIVSLLCIVAGIKSKIEITQHRVSQDDETKYAPAREIVVRSIAKTYSKLFHAADKLMDFDYKDYHLKSNDTVKGKSVYLKMATEDFEELNKNVQLNNAALGSNLMPVVSKFIESSKTLLKKLRYYVLLHNEYYMNRDFVTIPPFKELETIENLVMRLKKKYENIFNDRHVVYSYLKTYSEIKGIWEKAAKKSNRIFFQPSNYQTRKDRIVFTYDIWNLKAISVKNIQDRSEAQVFTYQ